MYGEVSSLVNIKLCQKSNCPVHSSYKYSKFALVLCQDLKNKIGQFLDFLFLCLNQLNWNKQMVNDSNKDLLSMCYTCKLCLTWWERREEENEKKMILHGNHCSGVLCLHYTTFPSSCVVVIIMPNFQERKLSFLNTNELLQGYSSGKWQSNGTNLYLIIQQPGFFILWHLPSKEKLDYYEGTNKQNIS